MTGALANVSNVALALASNTAVGKLLAPIADRLWLLNGPPTIASLIPTESVKL